MLDTRDRLYEDPVEVFQNSNNEVIQLRLEYVKNEDAPTIQGLLEQLPKTAKTLKLSIGKGQLSVDGHLALLKGLSKLPSSLEILHLTFLYEWTKEDLEMAAKELVFPNKLSYLTCTLYFARRIDD